jgi:hypothetical protein
VLDKRESSPDSLSPYLAIYLHAHHLRTVIQVHFGKGLCGQQRSKQIRPFRTEGHGPDSLDVCWPLLADGRAVKPNVAPLSNRKVFRKFMLMRTRRITIGNPERLECTSLSFLNSSTYLGLESLPQLCQQASSKANRVSSLSQPYPDGAASAVMPNQVRPGSASAFQTERPHAGSASDCIIGSASEF